MSDITESTKNVTDVTASEFYDVVDFINPDNAPD